MSEHVNEENEWDENHFPPPDTKASEKKGEGVEIEVAKVNTTVSVAYSASLTNSNDPPIQEYTHASGHDLVSIEDVEINRGETKVISTGLRIAIPEFPEPSLIQIEAQIRSRSGLAGKHGIFVLNSPGTIDADYRGEIKVILKNFGNQSYHVEKGDKVGQLVFAPVFRNIEWVKKSVIVDDTDRGSKGFGSTDKDEIDGKPGPIKNATIKTERLI
jgi:dUTP pyrophosphatase